MIAREEIINIIKKSIIDLQKDGFFHKFVVPEIKVGPASNNYGDYSVYTLSIINKEITIDAPIKRDPIEIADKIKEKIIGQKPVFLEKIEQVHGFLNFFLSKDYLQKQVGVILKEKESFGKLKIGRGQKVNVEFISANPTGPLTLGNGRGGFCGDVLANVLNKAGFQAKREYYINDTGEQIKKLGHSVIGDSEAVYQGPYIEELKKKIKGNDPEKVGKAAAKTILQEMIKPTVKKMKIKFNTWFSEKTLYQKEVNDSLDYLTKNNFTEEKPYENGKVLWFKSTKFGDDKDRVLIKVNGEKTYLASDVAYLKNKFSRGFKKLIFFWGADHYGYVARIKAAAEALGYKKEQINIIVMQLVRLIEGGKEVRMSKRTGIYVTIDELIDEVGLDVARFFFLTRSANTHLNFDLALAKTQSENNPVYYIQYAHARICSILKKSQVKLFGAELRTDLLCHPAELRLIKQLIRLPEIIEDIANDYQVQRLPQYAVDLATAFHQFYRDCQVLSDNINLQQARLSLVLATKIVLENTLALMGISAPEKM